MSKISICLALLMTLLLGTLMAQGSREVFLWEDFSGGTFPPTGWTISSNPSNWSVFAGANAGGAVPELRLSWTPQFTGASYFISPAIDTSGETNLLLDFRQFVDHYQNPFTVGVATRSGAGTWNTVWSANPTGNIGPELKTVAINNADVGATDFQFAFFFNGASYNIDYWFIDSIKLYTPFPFDLAITGSDLPVHVDAGTPVIPACTVKNVGLNPLTAAVSLSIMCQSEPVAQFPGFFSAYLAANESQTATAPVFTPPLANELYTMVFTVTSIEDVVDNDLANNMLNVPVNTWTGAKQMVVLEIGTGGWCPY